jgi:hypothetical protein
MRRRHFPGAKMMRILESAIITLSSSSGRGGQKSCTHFGGQEHSPLPFFCEGRPNNCQKSEKKQRTNTTANSFVFAPFRVRRSGHNQQQRATFGLNLKGGWRPFQPRKKKIRRRASLLLRYSWTRKRRRQHIQQQEEEEESISPSHASNTQERRACE